MKPFFLLFLVVSISIATIVDEQQEVEARVVKALGHSNYARLLKLSPPVKETFDDMVTELLDGQMNVVEFVTVLHHIAPSAHAVLLPIAKRRPAHPTEQMEMGTGEFLEMVSEELKEMSSVKKVIKTLKNEKKDPKKMEVTKKTIKATKMAPLSVSEFLDILASKMKLENEEKEVLGDMVADLVDGQMTAVELLDVLSHTSPSAHAALTRVANSISIDDFFKHLKLNKEDKEVAEVVEDMVHELIHGQMTVDEFLSVLSHTSPSAHHVLSRLVTDFNGRVAGLKTKEAKEFVKKITNALREVGKALFAHKDNEITKEQKDKEVMVQLLNTIRDYGAVTRDSEAASEEIAESFPDVMAMAQADAINRAYIGGYL